MCIVLYYVKIISALLFSWEALEGKADLRLGLTWELPLTLDLRQTIKKINHNETWDGLAGSGGDPMEIRWRGKPRHMHVT
jgi:hypothetical protein